jgi:hypothetical protein
VSVEKKTNSIGCSYDFKEKEQRVHTSWLLLMMSECAKVYGRFTLCGSLDELNNFTFQSTGKTFTENLNHTKCGTKYSLKHSISKKT